MLNFFMVLFIVGVSQFTLTALTLCLLVKRGYFPGLFFNWKFPFIHDERD